MNELDIVIPVYNEGENIIPVLEQLHKDVTTKFTVLICYDHDHDTTLKALESYKPDFEIKYVKNEKTGPHGAVLSGFKASTAEAILVFPADDTYNTEIIDPLMNRFREGYDLVVPSRFMRGGKMEGCPALKSFLVRLSAFSLYHFARLPVHDPTNGFRLFSRKIINQIVIESTLGFSFSLELLVKCHRLRWKIAEIPAAWYERRKGKSRFRIAKWLFEYLRWYFYAFATHFLKRGPETVPLRREKVLNLN